ncbi:MAG: cytidylate kinase-like family protein, partial [Lawsonibacter sp.]|nr:cytidylate kinase-like family protein [Lawsonibacter sp.]
MSGPLILAVSREFGSGGHEIARTLAEDFRLPLYEENILTKIAEARGVDPGRLAQYDELPKNRLMYRTVKGFSNAPEAVIAQMQFEYLKERAAMGESFVVLGRCAEEVLKGSPGLITMFVLADLPFKTERTMLRGPISEKEAVALIAYKDRKRKTYHNQFCKGK